MKKKAYIYYSGATDTTGKALAAKLKTLHGQTKPTGTDKICICWGCKTDKPMKMGNMPVLNHPDRIRENRHKFNTLKKLAAAGVYVGNHIDAKSIMRLLDNPTGDEPMVLPLIGRRNYHQGGKDFHICLSKGHVKKAIEAGAMYFRNHLDVTDEYRLHVFQGVVINAQRKTERKNMEDAYASQHGERIVNNAAKKNLKLDKATMDHVLKDLGGREGHANQIIKSNTKGWKFSQIKLANVKKNLAEAAIAAVEAVGLDFAAVDCVILEDGRAAIIELNTGPGLDGTPFEAYVGAFQEAIKAINSPRSASDASVAAKTQTSKTGTSVKQGKTSADRLRLMAEMLDSANEEETAVVNTLFNKMFG